MSNINKQVKVISDKVVCETPWLVMKNRTYENKHGQKNSWDMVSRPNDVKAVMIVAQMTNQKNERCIIITKEFRVPINDYEWGFPAGLIDDGESIKETVIREMKEETGLDVVDFGAISPFTYNSSGMIDESISMEFVEVSGTISNELLEKNEAIETFAFNRQEVLNILNNNKNKFGAKGWLIMKQFVMTGKVL